MACRPVLSASNGPVPARVVFLGEAPGRLGAGRTGVPFAGDTAGRRFEQLLAEAGLQREEVFVTNAVLCLPLDGAGRNRTPRGPEIRNCAGWLAETLDLVQPLVVVAMGGVALEAVRRLEPHDLTLRDAGAPPVAWRQARLAVTYHPGARSQAHRSWAEQLADWQTVGRFAGGSLTRGA